MGRLSAQLAEGVLPALARGEREALLMDAAALVAAGGWARTVDARAGRFRALAHDARLLGLAAMLLGGPARPVGVGVGRAPLVRAPELPDAALHLLVRLDPSLPGTVRPLPQGAADVLAFLARGAVAVASFRRAASGETAAVPAPAGSLWPEPAVCAG